MFCILCGGQTSVSNSRAQKKLKQVWRRRICKKCRSIFTTVEKISLDKSILIIKGEGQLEAFMREKLFISVYESLKHRKTCLMDSQALTDTIISKIFGSLNGSVVNVEKVKQITNNVLKNFDRAAAIQYLAYYPVKD